MDRDGPKMTIANLQKQKEQSEEKKGGGDGDEARVTKTQRDTRSKKVNPLEYTSARICF